jgi:phosphatidylglycerophosphatase C
LTTSREALQGPVAFFDVDKTITTEDTFLLLVREGLKEHPWRALILATLSPIFLATALFTLEKRLAKGAALWSLTVGRSEEEALRWLRAVVARNADRLWLPGALEEIRALEASGFTLIFVTASAGEWIHPLLEARGLGDRGLVGTRLKPVLGGIGVKGHNCFGEEKVRRIEEAFGSSFVWSKGYSDSIADLPMLRLCAERVLVTPTAPHRAAYVLALGEDGFREVGWR